MKRFMLFIFALCMVNVADAQSRAEIESRLAADIAKKCKPKYDANAARLQQEQQKREMQNKIHTQNAVRNVQQGRQYLEQVHADDFTSGNPDDFMQNTQSWQTGTETSAPKLESTSISKSENGDFKLSSTKKGIRSWQFAEQQWNNSFPRGGNYIEELGKKLKAKKFEKPKRTMANKKILQRSVSAYRPISSAEIKQHYDQNNSQGRVVSSENTRKELPCRIVFSSNKSKYDPMTQPNLPSKKRPIAERRKTEPKQEQHITSTKDKEPAHQKTNNLSRSSNELVLQQTLQESKSKGKMSSSEAFNDVGERKTGNNKGLHTKEYSLVPEVKRNSDNVQSGITVSLGEKPNIVPLSGSNINKSSKEKKRMEGLNMGYNTGVKINDSPNSPENQMDCWRHLMMNTAFVDKEGQILNDCYVERRKISKKK